MAQKIKTQTRARTDVRKLTGTAMLAAVASVLMYIQFIPPFMPAFIKFDFSEMPALFAAFAYGPLSGLAVSFIKNVASLTATSTGGVGELSNFLLSAGLVIPAGLVYQKYKSRKGAIVGALIGAVVTALMSVVTNYFVVYPIYTNFMPIEAIMGMYQTILPSVENLFQALVVFNMPYTFIKAIINLLIVILIYKPLSPLLNKK